MPLLFQITIESNLPISEIIISFQITGATYKVIMLSMYDLKKSNKKITKFEDTSSILCNN